MRFGPFARGSPRGGSDNSENGITYSLPQILAPFKTPLAQAARKKAIYAYNTMCRQNPHDCEVGAHAD